MEAGWPKTFHDLQLYQKASHHAKFGEDTTSGSWVVGFFVQKTSVFHTPFTPPSSYDFVIWLDGVSIYTSPSKNEGRAPSNLFYVNSKRKVM